MRCSYFEQRRCASCTLIEVPYPTQVAGKVEQAAARLPTTTWLPAVPSAKQGFRNKAKMVAGGTVTAPTLGILDTQRLGVDLIGCPLHERPIVDALPVLREFVTDAGLTPYSVPDRRGELKHVLVTTSPDAELMVRFVLRSTEAVDRLRKHLPTLLERLPIVVASANILPEHKAVTEGDQEIPLTAQQLLTMRLNGIPLLLRPGGFFQTNTAVAAALYREAVDWVAPLTPRTVTDLYCGVGGFALHLAGPDRAVHGVEVGAEAIDAARASAALLGLTVTFGTGDATADGVDSGDLDADVVVVNPPRRGIGHLATRLESGGARHVLYSSCNPVSLAADLALMPSLRPVQARLFDMFPQNRHAEVLILLERS